MKKKIFHNYYLQKKLFGTTICQNILWNHNLTKRIFWNNDLRKLFGTTFAKNGQLQQFATIFPEQQFARKNNWQNLRKISRTPICKKVFQDNNLQVENL